MRPTDVLNKIKREIKNSAKKAKHKTIRNGHVSINIPIMEAEKPSANKRIYSKKDMEEALKDSDCKVKPVTKVEDDNDLATFIKENIINKEPEYPEYDRVTANGTIDDLVRKSREMKRSQVKRVQIGGKKYEAIVVESASELPKDGGKPGAIYFVPLVKYQRDCAYKTYRWLRDETNPEGGYWQFNGYEAAEEATVTIENPEQKIIYDNRNISLIADAERAVDLTIKDKPEKKHDDQVDALSYAMKYIENWDTIKDIYYNDNEGLQYALDALNIKNVNVDEDSVEECLAAIEKLVDSKHVQWLKSNDKLENFDDLLEAAPYVDVFRNIKHVYIINGYARSGKDTFIQMAGEVFDFLESSKNTTVSISSVQGIKDISATYFGYDENVKSDKDRKFLSDFKSLTTEYCDYSLKYVVREIMRADLDGYKYVFIHIREPEEIKRAIDMIDKVIFPHYSHKLAEYEYDTDKMFAVRKGFAPQTVFVKRDDIRRVTNNSSDTDVENYEYDHVIDNSGSLESLRMYAKHFAIQKFGGIAN